MVVLPVRYDAYEAASPLVQGLREAMLAPAQATMLVAVDNVETAETW